MELHVRMVPRDPNAGHRAATPLELFFDLTFVVAIAQAASGLHHGLVDGHGTEALIAFPFVFFAIWWAWMNFTWFASAYDTDDAVYRLMLLVQMTGVLILAAGVPRAMEGRALGTMTLGYLVMRLAQVAQWLRAAASHPEGRRCALRYAVGISIVQVGWLVRLQLPNEIGLPLLLILWAGELTIPLWAEMAGRTPWHPSHIAERYALFTIIVLGESVLAATMAVQVALDGESTVGDLATLVVGGLLIVFSMWWLYFDMPAEEAMARNRQTFDDRLTGAFAWGYGHYFVFAGAAATGAGLAVAVDQATGHSVLTDLQAALATTVPTATYLLTVWALHRPYQRPGWFRTYPAPITAALILAASFTPAPVVVTGSLMAVLVALGVVTYRRTSAAGAVQHAR